MNIPLILAILCLALWVLLAFVLAIPSGWAHVPLAAGIVLLTIGIVEGGSRAKVKDHS